MTLVKQMFVPTPKKHKFFKRQNQIRNENNETKNMTKYYTNKHISSLKLWTTTTKLFVSQFMTNHVFGPQNVCFFMVQCCDDFFV